MKLKMATDIQVSLIYVQYDLECCDYCLVQYLITATSGYQIFNCPKYIKR